jgi:hypothetical protein
MEASNEILELNANISGLKNYRVSSSHFYNYYKQEKSSIDTCF